MSLRNCLSMPRTAGIGYWKASSHDPKVLGSGASAAIVCVQANDCGWLSPAEESGVDFGVSVTPTDRVIDSMLYDIGLEWLFTNWT